MPAISPCATTTRFRDKALGPTIIADGRRRNARTELKDNTPNNDNKEIDTMRLNTYAADPAGAKRLSGWSEHLVRGPINARIRALVDARVSQINGCAFCLAMHSADARAASVTQEQLDSLAAWRDDDSYAADERAALDLSEAMTRLADGGRVTDEIWARAAECFDEDALAALVQGIALINAYNRINVATRRSAQEYAEWRAVGLV